MPHNDPPRLVLALKAPSPHVVPLADALYHELGERFRVVYLLPKWDYRHELGWGSEGLERPYVIRAWNSDADSDIFSRDAILPQERFVTLVKSSRPPLGIAAKNAIEQADVVVFMDIPPALFDARITAGKWTFLATERPLLRGLLTLHYRRVRRIFASAWRHRKHERYHLLAIGQHCATDFARFGLFDGRCWQLGYFSEISERDPHKPCGQSRSETDSSGVFPGLIPVASAVTAETDTLPLVSGTLQPFTILWAGRMVRFKRLEVLIESVRRFREQLQRESATFPMERPIRMRLIGGGKMLTTVQRWVRRAKIDDITTFESFQPVDQIYQAMRAADLYAFSSDLREGWGVVVNESMGQGCPVVASDDAGSTAWLIAPGTGLLCPNDARSAQHFADAFVRCYRDPDFCGRMGHAAWQYVHHVWSSTVAARRLVGLFDHLRENKPLPFDGTGDGPCTPADSKTSRWLRDFEEER